MTRTYTLEEEDFLAHQLFTATHSPIVQKARKRTLYLIPILYGGIAIVTGLLGNYFSSAFLLIVAILWVFLYPLWQKRRYQNYYTNFIREHYKNRIGKSLQVTFTDTHIHLQSDQDESKIALSSLVGFHELPEHILAQLQSGVTIIFPKKKIESLDTFRSYLQQLAATLNLPFEDNTSWIWK